MNAFTEFLNSYAGLPTKADALTAQAQADMIRLYEDCYIRVEKALRDSTKTINWWTFAKQTEVMKGIARELDKFRNQSGALIGKSLADVARIMTTKVISDINLYHDLQKSKTFHYEFNSSHAEQAARDAYGHIAAQTMRMSETVKQLLREQATAVFRRASVEGLTRKAAAKAIREQVASRDPSFQFVDRAGRRWDNKAYFDMLTRTVMMNEMNESYVNTMVAEKQDLVKVSIHGAIDACRGWEGRILSLTGKTRGYPTLDYARATKEVFHPRCRHRLVAYHPDIDRVFEQVAQGMSEKEILADMKKLKSSEKES